MNFGTSLLVIFILTCTGLVIYWFYHKYKLEREQVRFMQWARSVMRERYDSDSDSSSTNPRYRTDSTWSNTSNDSSANLVEEGDHHDHSISYGAIDYNSRNNNSETPKNYGLLSCLFLFICISGACLLFINDYIFSNFIFILLVISCALPCLFYIKKRETQINYHDEDYEALLISVHDQGDDEKNENPPIYKN